MRYIAAMLQSLAVLHLCLNINAGHPFIKCLCLLETYNDRNNNNIKLPAFNNQYFDDVGESCNATKDFDLNLDLFSLEFTQVMDYIHLHYKIANQNKKQSGSHDELHSIVGRQL
jgi:hypothetical protein